MKKKFFANLWLTFHSWSPLNFSFICEIHVSLPHPANMMPIIYFY